MLSLRILSTILLLVMSISQVYAGIARNIKGELKRTGNSSSTNTFKTTSVSYAASSPVISEGVQLLDTTWDRFWDPDFQHFRTEKKTSETVGDFNGYTLWPYVIGIEALLEGEAVQPGLFSDKIDSALKGMEKFFSNEYNAYTAWIWTPGNSDIYYDDNAQVVIALLRAYELGKTSKIFYLSQAKSVIDFLATGWDSARGGVRWHLGSSGRNACTTSLTAVAMLTLAKMGERTPGKSRDELIEFARAAVEWILSELQLGSGLIMDGDGGGPTYTYNTGITLHAICMLQELSPGYDGAAKAKTLAEAALDRNKSLFDTTVPDTVHRYWWDNTYFLHLLIEGLSEYIRVYGGSNGDIVSKIQWEFQRHSDYMRNYMKDESDGLYWRGLKLYTISLDRLAVYRNLTGDTTREASLNQEERAMDGASLALPVGDRELVKTLLGSGGAARSFLIAGRNI